MYRSLILLSLILIYMCILIDRTRARVAYNPPTPRLRRLFGASSLAFAIVVVVVALVRDARLFVVRQFNARQLGGRFIGAHGHRVGASRSKQNKDDKKNTHKLERARYISSYLS